MARGWREGAAVNSRNKGNARRRLARAGFDVMRNGARRDDFVRMMNHVVRQSELAKDAELLYSKKRGSWPPR